MLIDSVMHMTILTFSIIIKSINDDHKKIGGFENVYFNLWLLHCLHFAHILLTFVSRKSIIAKCILLQILIMISCMVEIFVVLHLHSIHII